MRKEFMLIASLVAATFANDARVNALGGSYMFDDVNDIYYNPAHVTKYEVIEGNITTFTAGADETMGAGLATWHINDNLVIGGYFNQDHDVAPIFNNDSYAYVAPGRQASPHVLVGIKLSDNFSLGFDGGLEINKTFTKTGETENMQKARVLSAGLGANIELNAIDLDISAGIALPKSEVTAKTSALDTTTKDVSGFVLDVDAYATLELDTDLDLVAGAYLNTQKVEDSKAPDNTAHPKELAFGVIAGVAKDFEADFALGLSAEFGMMKETNSETDDETTNSGVLFVAAAEKTFGQTKLFDTHTFRLGYGHAFTKTNSVTDNGDGNDDTESKGNGSWMDEDGNEDIGLSAGFGITRGKFGLDFYVSQVNFDFNSNDAGLWDVLPVAGATMTIDFAKKGSTLRGKKKAAAASGDEW